MILEILNKDYASIQRQLLVVFMCFIIVVLSIGIDLYFGIKKSKVRGVFTHSFGLRQTSKKTVEYLALMLFMFFIDVLNPFWVYFDYVALPLFSIFGAIVLVYTEWKSVREKSSEKFRLAIKEHPTEVIDFMLKNKEKIDELISNFKKKEDQDRGI